MTRDTMARLAGLLYLAGLPTAGFAYGYVAFVLRTPEAVLHEIVEGGAVETLRATVLIGVPGFSIFYLIEALLLRELLKPVSKLAADLMVLLVAASVPLALVALARRMDLIALLEQPGLPSIAAVAPPLRAEHNLFQIASIFWGAWLLPLAYLSWRARFVPRIIAALLAIAGLGYLWAFTEPLLFGTPANPFAHSPVATLIMVLTMAGELGFGLWLAIFGVKGLKAGAIQA